MNRLLQIVLPVLMWAILSLNASAQSKKAQDLMAIKSMAGCYDIEFKYTETFAPEVDYEFAYVRHRDLCKTIMIIGLK